MLPTFPKFEDNKVSTNTFVMVSNLKFDIDKIFDEISLTDFSPIYKRRGRKRKDEHIITPPFLPDGSIVSLSFKGKKRGISMKKKINSTGKFFRNSMTAVMLFENAKKNINFKITDNGKFQITGCQNEEQARMSVVYLLENLNKLPSPSYKWENSNNPPSLTLLIIPVLKNVGFNIGFPIDRLKIDTYFNTNTPHNSLFEPGGGYAGVNIVFQLSLDLPNILCNFYEYDFQTKSFTHSTKLYKEYLDNLTEKERQKKLTKKYKNTFLIFHSGKCILSGINTETMKESYNEFIELIKTGYDDIRENLRKKEK